MQTQNYLNAGEISGVFGIKGWVKVYSFTEPRENILNYSPWLLQKNGENNVFDVIFGQRQGNLVVASLSGIHDRDQAVALMGAKILIERSQLPKTQADEYYWTDLVGLAVENESGIRLGKVDHLIETGANDVLVVIDDDKTERLIPFLQNHTVRKVDLQQGLILVDWDADF